MPRRIPPRILSIRPEPTNHYRIDVDPIGRATTVDIQLFDEPTGAQRPGTLVFLTRDGRSVVVAVEADGEPIALDMADLLRTTGERS